MFEDRLLGKVILVLGSAAFAYYSAWVLLTARPLLRATMLACGFRQLSLPGPLACKLLCVSDADCQRELYACCHTPAFDKEAQSFASML